MLNSRAKISTCCSFVITTIISGYLILVFSLPKEVLGQPSTPDTGKSTPLHLLAIELPLAFDQTDRSSVHWTADEFIDPGVASSYSHSKVHWPGIAITSAALAGIYTAIFTYEKDRRWNGPRTDFFFTHTLTARGVDKLGHFYATKAQASFIGNLYSFSIMPRRPATLLGAGMALSIQTMVELKDGRVADRGFGVYDEIANTLGAAWYVARELRPGLQRFQVRWLYYPSENRDLLEPGYRFTEDYTGHSYWISSRVWDLLPFYWPKVIVPAVGITLNDWVPNSSQQGFYSVHLSLNPDFNYIFTGESKISKALADLFNGFYMPAPALQLYPNLGFKIIFVGSN